MVVEDSPTAFVADLESKAAHGLVLECNGVEVRGEKLRLEDYKKNDL